ncbi:MAG: hypothetical protein L6R40_005021 [Gallowayella cf. fulva]|nr:MAG: hypothetical protein L6R40_005021 [Xanthomendoza cf. fulva]
MEDKSSVRMAEKKDKLEGGYLGTYNIGHCADNDQAQVKSADMTDEMQQQAIDVALEAMEKFTIEKDIAQYIKKEV